MEEGRERHSGPAALSPGNPGRHADGRRRQDRQAPPTSRRPTNPPRAALKPAHENAYPSGDSPKPQGDKLQHAVDEAAERKKK